MCDFSDTTRLSSEIPNAGLEAVNQQNKVLNWESFKLVAWNESLEFKVVLLLFLKSTLSKNCSDLALILDTKSTHQNSVHRNKDGSLNKIYKTTEEQNWLSKSEERKD